MGNGSGSPPHVSCPPDGDAPDPPTRNEKYKHLKTLLCESHDSANGLQQFYATDVVKLSWHIDQVKNMVKRYSMMTKLYEKEATQKAKNTIEELDKYWFRSLETIILSVIERLNNVKIDHTHQLQKNNLSSLISKLKTDCMPLLKTTGYQSSKNFKEVRITDNCDGVRSSKGQTNDSSNNSKEDGKTEPTIGVETDNEIEDRFDEHKEYFRLLYTCTLILETESYNCSKICDSIDA